MRGRQNRWLRYVSNVDGKQFFYRLAGRTPVSAELAFYTSETFDRRLPVPRGFSAWYTNTGMPLLRRTASSYVFFWKHPIVLMYMGEEVFRTAISH